MRDNKNLPYTNFAPLGHNTCSMKKITLLALTLSFIYSLGTTAQSSLPIILDADTANEVDDLFAVVRCYAEPSFELEALSAVQWQSSQWATDQSMEDSHRLNLLISAYLNTEGKTKLLRGGHKRMYDWGDRAVHSAAAYHISERAKAAPADGKITVVALGALTNVASALFIDPSIASKIELYWLGTSYDFDKNISKRTDFNAIMDPQALELLLSSQVEMHIMPVSEVAQMTSNFSETKQLLKDKHPLGDFLIQRWFEHIDPNRKERVLWDLALIEAMVHPEWVTEESSDAFENKNVFLYRNIDENWFLEDAMSTILKKLEEIPDE